MTKLRREHSVAVGATLEAVALLSRMLTVGEVRIARSVKAGGEAVSAADRALNEILVRHVARAFPGDAILAEEGGSTGREGASRCWFIDPIDGTRSFLDGRAGYSIMVALVADGVPEIGVIWDCQSGDVYSAIRGRGIRVFGGHASPAPAGARARRLIWDPYAVGDESARVRLALGFRETLLRESMGLRAIAMMRGEGALFLSRPRMSRPWDTAAPLVFVREIGGSFTDLDGNPLVYDPEAPRHARGGVASLGLHHGDTLEAMREIFDCPAADTSALSVGA